MCRDAYLSTKHVGNADPMFEPTLQRAVVGAAQARADAPTAARALVDMFRPARIRFGYEPHR
jgi:hypothetical protein